MAPQSKKSIDVSILVDNDYIDKLQQVTSDLKEKGFVLKQSLDAIGVLTGSIPEKARQALAKVRGVSKVEDEQTDYHTQ